MVGLTGGVQQWAGVVGQQMVGWKGGSAAIISQGESCSTCSSHNLW